MRVEGSVFRVQGSGFRVQGLGFRDSPPGPNARRHARDESAVHNVSEHEVPPARAWGVAENAPKLRPWTGTSLVWGLGLRV